MASLTYKGYQLYDTAVPPSRRFWIEEGGPFDADWEVRGIDDVYSSLAGRDETNRVKDVLPIVVPGYINGVGVDIATQRTNFYTTLAAMAAVLQTDSVIGPLVWVAPNATTYTINARFIRRTRGDWEAGLFRRYTLEFESIDPLGWT